MMLDFREERMSAAFVKFHVGGLPFPAVFHHFSEPDEGPPHDHPFPFETHILSGSYVERVYQLDGTSRDYWRLPGDVLTVPAAHIHRIVDLPEGECWTIMLPKGPTERVPGFYEFRDDGAWHRFWHESDFTRRVA